MPLTTTTATVTADPPDGVTLTIGPETIRIARVDMKDILRGGYRREWIVIQVAKILNDAGLNPLTATFAQVKSAIEADSIWVVT